MAARAQDFALPGERLGKQEREKGRVETGSEPPWGRAWRRRKGVPVGEAAPQGRIHSRSEREKREK